MESLPIFKKLSEIVPREQAKIKALKTTHGEVQIGTCTVDQAYGGMRSVQSMIWETSLLDAQEGIRFRGYSIPELQKALPKAVANGEPVREKFKSRPTQTLLECSPCFYYIFFFSVA